MNVEFCTLRQIFVFYQYPLIVLFDSRRKIRYLKPSGRDPTFAFQSHFSRLLAGFSYHMMGKMFFISFAKYIFRYIIVFTCILRVFGWISPSALFIRTIYLCWTNCYEENALYWYRYVQKRSNALC